MADPVTAAVAGGAKIQGAFEMGKTNQTGTTTKRRVVDQAGLDKMMYDLLAQDQGLAALASGENLVGGFNSSSKTLLAQDFLTKVLGEMALLTAPEISDTQATTRTKKTSIGIGDKGSVICTELVRQGRLPADLYNQGIAHFHTLSPYTVSGYRLWAEPVVRLMQKSPRLSAVLAPIAISRYEMTTERKFCTFWGVITIYGGQPICYLIGRIYAALKGEQYGTAQSA